MKLSHERKVRSFAKNTLGSCRSQDVHGMHNRCQRGFVDGSAGSRDEGGSWSSEAREKRRTTRTGSAMRLSLDRWRSGWLDLSMQSECERVSVDGSW